MKPDIAVLTLDVVVERPVANDAVAEDAKAANAVVAALKDQGVDARDLMTAGLALTPVITVEREPKTGEVVKSVVTGYRASNSLRVRIRAIDKVGTILSGVVRDGATRYQGLWFDISDREAREDTLRVKAIGVAAHRAALYAEGASLKLGPVLAINPQNEQVGPAFAAPMRAMAAGVSTPVEPGLITLSQTVTATWALTGQ